MTKVTFFKRDGVFYGFRETGHTGYGESGDDILCSALSAMTMLIINTVEISYASNIEYVIDEVSTDITVKCPSALPDSGTEDCKRYAIAGLFQGYYYQLNDLTEEYYDFLEVNVEEA